MTTTDRERAAFVAAVCASPGDDTPRLVFADWLDENGDPDRAALIRWQVRTGIVFQRDPDARRWRHKKTGGRGWSPPVGCWLALNGFLSDPWPGSFTVSRGFVSALTTPAADFLKHADALLWSPEQVELCDYCSGLGYTNGDHWYDCRACGGGGGGGRKAAVPGGRPAGYGRHPDDGPGTRPRHAVR